MIPFLIFDTMVLLQAASQPSGTSRQCIDEVFEDRALSLLSEERWAELRDVFSRPKVSRKVLIG